jgi:hypothetical protein
VLRNIVILPFYLDFYPSLAHFDHMPDSATETQTQTQTPTDPRARFRGRPGNDPGYRDPIGQAVDWQRALNHARELKTEKLLVSLAQGSRAWAEIERLKREIRMQPKPRPIDVSGGRGRGRKAQVVSMPVDAPPPSKE